MKAPQGATLIGLDNDGVMYDFVDGLRGWIHHSTGRPLSELPDATCWHFYDTDWGYTTEEFLTLFAAGVNAGVIFGHGAPYPGTRAALQRLSEAGRKLVIVTNRAIPGVDPEWAEQLTRQWVNAWDLPIDDVILSADKTVADVQLFLEDHLDNYDALEAAGIHPVLFNRPWNVCEKPRYRVNNWDEFCELVETYEG